MVTFRFYVVSTVAFFLALAVGVVVGSVLDGQIADSLRDRLDGVEESLDDTVEAIDDKNAELDLQERYIEESAPFATQDTMTGTATLVVAETGLDGATVEDLVRRLRQGGSRVEGVVWLDPRMDLAERSDRQVVAGLIGAPESTSVADLRIAMWDTVLAAGAGSAASGEGAGTTTTLPEPGESGGGGPAGAPSTEAPEPTAPDTDAEAQVPVLFEQSPLADLADAGLVRLQNVDGGSDAQAEEFLVVGITGPRATTATPGQLIAELGTAAAGAGVPALLAEAHPDSGGGHEREDRGALLAFDDGTDPAGSATISTVDDLEWLPGRVAAVLALADLRQGRSGRYGLGPEVDGLLPPWQGP